MIHVHVPFIHLTPCSGVASILPRFTLIAAECLDLHHEQDEAYSLLWIIKRKTGWPIDSLLRKLKSDWGRDADTFTGEAFNQSLVETHHVMAEPEHQISGVAVSQSQPHGQNSIAGTHSSGLTENQQPLQSYASSYYQQDFQAGLSQGTSSDIQSQLMQHHQQYSPPNQSHSNMIQITGNPPTSRQPLNGYQFYTAQHAGPYQPFQQAMQTNHAAQRFMNVASISTSAQAGPSHSNPYTSY